MDRPLPHFIIVDDDREVRYLMRLIIQRRFPRVEITEAADGVEALRFFEEQGADLMVIDHNLPTLSGADLTRELRSRGVKIPLVMVSNFPAAAVEAEAAGASAFVGKDRLNPCLGEQLLKLLGAKGNDHKEHSGKPESE
jgi:CheY-like chemotaxis protein